MAIVGELFDQKMAAELISEMNQAGLKVEGHLLSTASGSIIQIHSTEESSTVSAQEYFRVRMGLPGAPTELDPAWLEIKAKPFGIVTKSMVLVSVAIFLTSFKPLLFEQLCDLLFFNRPGTETFSSLGALELWRLITPIFLHFGWLHIAFNCLWIKDLGSYWESEVGVTGFCSLVAVLAITSNLGQYIAIGPTFGGLSGVVYGLFGLSWGCTLIGMKDAIQLPKRDIVLMVGWYFLCLTGLIGNIANVAHGVGLGIGLICSLVVFKLKQGHRAERVGTLKTIGLGSFFCISSFFIEAFKSSFF